MTHPNIELMRRYRPALPTYANESHGYLAKTVVWRMNWVWALYVLGLFCASLYQLGHEPPFLYQGF